MELVRRIDDYGKPAWIGIMILSFMIFWPVGLAVLGYMIWSGRMGCSRHRRRGKWMWPGDNAGHGNTHSRGFSRAMRAWSQHAPASGNRAFDEYRAETLKRLEDEFDEFQDFLEQLRAARDKEEFDKFMASRGKTVDAKPEKPGKDDGDQPAA